eukprot:15592269-Heterocapsa_arctica.AAC.1
MGPRLKAAARRRSRLRKARMPAPLHSLTPWPHTLRSSPVTSTSTGRMTQSRTESDHVTRAPQRRIAPAGCCGILRPASQRSQDCSIKPSPDCPHSDGARLSPSARD